ncbi:recombinase RecT [Labrys sp. WJW]|uniref:recombinase RecT n=1 Tax=Labrys sp. WJW TaxID=1737983 RepID=UPI0012E9F613|nr:recombinase RecT [Labrys sp. WJW]
MANALVHSSMAPVSYRENMGDALIALDIAQRINASPLMVMQNLNIIEGRPSWASQFIIAALNACGKFSPIRFRIVDEGEKTVSYERWTGPKGDRKKETISAKVRNKTCIATAVEKATGEVLEGPEASIAMAVAEGWYHRSGSKWVTMPDLMLRYRAAAFFGRLYAPDLLMGFQTNDEVSDLQDVEYTVVQEAPARQQAQTQAAPVEVSSGRQRRPRGVQAAMEKDDAGQAAQAKQAAATAPAQARTAAPTAPKEEEAPPVDHYDGPEDGDNGDFDGNYGDSEDGDTI